jgi:dolichyl-phosphate beta-glucosyltransferase
MTSHHADGREIVIVVPCFNEAARLDDAEFLRLLDDPDVRIVFVDDGSRDGTSRRLATLRARGNGRIEVLELGRNSGKGEAVRHGLLHGLTRAPRVVGYVDADLSTPVDEIVRLYRSIDERGVPVVLGSRVRLLGTDIRRRELRHYLGRVFATAASLTLRLPVYDTQCGAKFFRAGDAIREAIGRPFRSRWAFDVELIGRLLTGDPPLRESDFVEIPLQRWTDVTGSLLGPRDMARAALDMVGIAAELRRRRSRQR